jgi:hypothetical protein
MTATPSPRSPSVARRAPLCLLFAALLVPISAHAEPARVGGGPDALPAVYEVPFATLNPLGFGARLGLDYGLTESVLDADDTHHRAQLSAAGSLTPLPWFSTSLRLLGRYDGHIEPDAKDDGVLTEAHASARAAGNLTPELRSGAELALWMPGGDSVGDSLRALSGDLQGMLTYAPARSAFTVGLSLGLRIDRSRYSGGDPSLYSAADRLALGVSDSMWAARFGLALSYRLAAVDLLAEWAWKLYFSYAGESPMWLRAGVRYRVSRLWQLEALLGVSPSQRPSLAASAPVALVEPRFSAGLSAALTLPWEAESSVSQQPAEAEPEPFVEPQGVSARGRVQTSGAEGIAGATLEFRRGEDLRQVVSDAAGDFALDDLAAGPYQLSVSAPGWTAHQAAIELRAGANPPLEITLKRELPQAQIRGTVRSFGGAPLTASIAIPALRLEQSSRPDGTFEIDVAPGEYAITVKAKGYQSQTRRARVEQNGVAILIVELQPDGR